MMAANVSGNSLAAALRACELPAMKPARLTAFALALLLGAAAATAQTSSTNKPAPPAPTKSVATTKAAPPAVTGSFDDFKTIPDRNIFNTRRFAGRSASSETPPPTTRRERVVETFSLLGTMQYEKGRIAFFEGSSSSSKKSVKVDESIAGCKITAIDVNGVTVEANGKPVELKVGFMLRREDDGAWEPRVAERPMEFTYSSSSFGSSSASPFSSSSRFGSSPFGSSSSSSSFFSRDSRSSSSSSRFGSSSPQEYAQTRLREQDRNGDGRISRDEADSRMRDRFREIDRDGDGYVTGEEYTAYYVTRMGGGSSSSFPSSGSSFTPSAPSSGSSFSSPPFGSSPFGGSTSSSSAPPPSTGSSSSSSTGGAGDNDLLRRLMEQRARENR